MVRALPTILLLPLAVACGDDGGGGDESPFPSDIRNDSTLGEIGVDELDRLCRGYRDWVDEQYTDRISRSSCADYAMRVSATREDCDSNYRTCMDDIPSFVGGQPATILGQAQCSGVVNYTDCTTVLQLKTCLSALTARLDEPRFDLSCDSFGDSVPFDWWTIETPPECEVSALDCGAVVDTDGGV